jgi:hypothetical protein
MKKMNLFYGALALVASISILIAADHTDVPSVATGTADITDFYAFQGEDTDNIAFVVNVQGLMSPTETMTATFNENVLLEINIDTNADNVEDLVIQAISRDGEMYFFGPYSPSITGLNSTISSTVTPASVMITPYGSAPIITTENSIKYFAGPRDDPFFMDFARYGEIIGGMAPGFNNPGNDTFAGTNVLSVVVEVPKSMIGGSGTINTWVESKTKS